MDKYLVQDRTGEILKRTVYVHDDSNTFAKYPKKSRLQYVKKYYDAISKFKINIPTLL